MSGIARSKIEYQKRSLSDPQERRDEMMLDGGVTYRLEVMYGDSDRWHRYNDYPTYDEARKRADILVARGHHEDLTAWKIIEIEVHCNVFEEWVKPSEVDHAS